MSEVLALKYRPKNFDSLIGQDSITQILSLALTNKRLSHAYLFSGLRGSGKTSTARIFSKALVCDKGPTPTPCEVCENCQMANENRHIDIIEMDAASSRKIDDIRDVIEQTKYKPNIARFKIFIIDEVHMLTREAFNALLKTLEEPPEYVKFILATTDPLKLPATILSRTQHFRFKALSSENIVKHLSYILHEEKIEHQVEALEMIARAGKGSLRDSLTLLDQAIIYSKSNITSLNVADMLGFLDSKKLDEIFEMIFSEDKNKILNTIKELESLECEVILDELIAYVKGKFFAQDVQFSMLLCERFFRILSEAKQLLFINADSGFVLTLVFFKMLEALNIKKVDELIESFEKDKFQVPLHESKEQYIAKDETKIDDKYKNLVQELGSRNYELGKCFQDNVSFVSFEDNILKLKSKAQDENRQILRHGFGLIKQFTKEIFGKDTQIVVEQISEENIVEQSEKTSKEKEELEKKTKTNLSENLNQSEQGVQDILQKDTIKHAKELFKPSRIKIIPIQN